MKIKFKKNDMTLMVTLTLECARQGRMRQAEKLDKLYRRMVAVDENRKSMNRGGVPTHTWLMIPTLLDDAHWKSREL